MTIEAKRSFFSSASCHHTERISCKITGIWKLQPVVSPPPENVSTQTSVDKIMIFLNGKIGFFKFGSDFFFFL